MTSHASIRDRWREPVGVLSFSLSEANLVVVAGAGLSASAGLPTWPELQDAMLSELGSDAAEEKPDGPMAALIYERQRGRDEFISFLRRQLPPASPSDAHLVLADLPVSEYFTTNYDRILEVALGQVDKDPLTIADDGNFHELSSASVLTPAVVKLNGELENPDSLIITEADFVDYEQRRPNILQHAIDSLKLHEVLFLGVSFNDPWLKYMRNRSRAELGGSCRKRYVVWRDCSPAVQEAYAQLGLEVIQVAEWEELPDFLGALREAAGRRLAEARGAGSVLRQLSPRHVAKELGELADRHWKSELQRIAGSANSGLYSLAQRELAALLDRVQRPGPMVGSDAVLSVAHRLAAELALSSRTEGFIGDATEHLAKARDLYPEGDDSPKLVQAQARLHAASGDADAAIDLLHGYEDRESVLLRFSIHTEMAWAGAEPEKHLRACHRMQEEGALDLTATAEDEDVARIATLFFGLAGEAQELRQAADDLIRHNPSGRNHQIAGEAFARAAVSRYRDLCDDYGLPFGVPVLIDPGELVDHKLSQSAARHFGDAARVLAQRNAQAEAEAAAEDALRIAVQEEMAPLAHEVRNWVSEGSPALRLAANKWPTDDEFAEGRETSGSLTRAFDRAAPNELPGLLKVAMTLTLADESAATDVLKLLWQNRRLFTRDPLMALEWTRDVAQLCALLEAREERVSVDGAVLSPSRVIGQLHPPSVFAWFPHALECQAHLSSHPRTEGALEAARAAVERARELADPDNPEILLADYHVARLSDEVAAQTECAERLVELMKTQQTVELYLTALLLAEDWHGFLAVLAEAIEDGLENEDSLWVRNNRAMALLYLQRTDEATRDLEWVCDPVQAVEPEDAPYVRDAAHNLASVYCQQGRYDAAANMLCDVRSMLPEDEVELVLRQSQVLLDAGKAQQAFSVLKREATTYAGVRRFDLHLYTAAFRSGDEDDPVARGAGQRLFEAPDDEYVRKIVIPREGTLGAFGEMLRERSEVFRFVESQYVAGTMPFIPFACSPVINRPVCELWWRMGREQMPRYVGLSSAPDEVEWLTETRPNAAVLDYTTLLLLCDVVPTELGTPLDLIGQLLEAVLVPHSLRVLLDREQSSLAAVIHQPSRVDAAREVYTALRRSGKLRRAPAITDQADPTGELSARRHAAHHGLVYVTAYPQQGPVSDEEVASVREFAGFLETQGVLSRQSLTKLQALDLPDVTAVTPDWDRLRDARAAVLDRGALNVLLKTDALADTIHWLDVIHVPEVNIVQFEAWQEESSWVAGCGDRFAQLREELERRDDIVQWVALGADDRILVEDQLGEGEWSLSWDCFFDFMNVAVKTGAPLWTDDRATRAFAVEDHTVRRFGTDAMIQYSHREGRISDDQYAELTSRLLRAGVLSLPIDPIYLAQMLRSAGDEDEGRA
ncbi:MAG: SIR2 family protein [Armatimonadota bacterium]|nr:SIR2 family protein [Armatimonadota bacterium]